MRPRWYEIELPISPWVDYVFGALLIIPSLAFLAFCAWLVYGAAA